MSYTEYPRKLSCMQQVPAGVCGVQAILLMPCMLQVCCNAGVPAILAVAAAVFTQARDAPIGLAGRPAAACLGAAVAEKEVDGHHDKYCSE